MATDDSLRRAKRLAEKVRAAQVERDDAIRAARADGHSLREIAAATGLSHQTINNVAHATKEH